MDDLLKLEGETPHTTRQFMAGVLAAVKQSFREDKKRDGKIVLTDDEVRRRTEICAKLVRDMRLGADEGQRRSAERIIDELPRLLREKLDGKVPNLTRRRSIWAPPSREAKVAPRNDDEHRIIRLS